MSKLKAVKPKQAQQSKPKILVFGKTGVRKSWVALEFPKPYYMDCEGGANLPAYIAKLEKSGGIYFGPDEGAQDFTNVINEIKALATTKHDYKTLVIDSKTKIFNIEIAKEMERLGDKDAFGASKKPAVNLSRRLISWLDKLDMTVVIICHEKPMWANGEQIGVTYDGYDKLEYELHLCLNIVKTGETSKAFVKKSRLPGFVDCPPFEWSYEEFAKRYGKDIIEAEVKPVVMANEEQIAEVKSLLDVVKLTDSTKDKWIAENVDTLAEVEVEKVDGIIKHLKEKITPKEPK